MMGNCVLSQYSEVLYLLQGAEDKYAGVTIPPFSSFEK